MPSLAISKATPYLCGMRYVVAAMLIAFAGPATAGKPSKTEQNCAELIALYERGDTRRLEREYTLPPETIVGLCRTLLELAAAKAAEEAKEDHRPRIRTR